MSCISLDMSIDSVLADPVIGAVMRADRVDPQRFEALLRSKAHSLHAARQPRATPLATIAYQVRRRAEGALCGW